MDMLTLCSKAKRTCVQVGRQCAALGTECQGQVSGAMAAADMGSCRTWGLHLHQEGAVQLAALQAGARPDEADDAAGVVRARGGGGGREHALLQWCTRLV